MTMRSDGYFDIKRDIEIINAGGFFCQACLVGKPAQEQSPDPRYCQFCYEFLLKEAEMDTRRREGDWKPVKSSIVPVEAFDKADKADKQGAQVSEGMRRIMSTLEAEKSKVDIILPTVASRAASKRGRKHKQLPEDLIRQLAAENMGSKAIATKLTKEQGIPVSYKTIQRVLSGQRE